MGQSTIKIMLGLAAACGAGSAAGGAHAQAQDDKYWIEIAGYQPRISTTVAVNRPGAPGTDVDFEKDLGLDTDKWIGSLEGGARFGNRWQVIGEIFSLNRSGEHTLNRDIEFDGVIYHSSATVTSEFQSDIYRVAVGYDIHRDTKSEFGVSLGLHATDFSFDIAGQATGPGGGTASSQRRARDFLAPMPTIGLFGGYDLNPHVTLNGRIDYLSLKVGDYDGSVTNFTATVAYRWNQTFAVGAGYRYVGYTLDVEKSDYTAKVDYNFSGPEIFLRMGFR
jgi:hypothetical protein